jgi:hypothetical protein
VRPSGPARVPQGGVMAGRAEKIGRRSGLHGIAAVRGFRDMALWRNV